MRLFCWIFMLSVAIISPIFLDLYPFSVFPMFSDNASEYVVIQVNDAEGNELKGTEYGLHKPLLANRSQRYGHQLGPYYFEENETIEIEQVKAFLAANFPDQKYPIIVRHWKRGFDESTKTIQNLTEPEEFRIDEVSLALSKNEPSTDLETTAQYATGAPSGNSTGQARNQSGDLGRARKRVR